MTVIETRNLTHIYNADTALARKALDNINLTVESGECIGLIGRTGSGKSTLIQHFNALLKPTSGQVLINGEDILADKKRLKHVRERVGLVFQYPEHQLFELTVYKDVAFGPHNMGLTSEEIDRRVREALSMVGLPEDVYEKSPFELSGGQKRRAAIAGVLAMKPDVLVLDEPTAGLDPGGRDEILAQIQALRANTHCAVILVSHSMEDVARLADRIIVLSEGRIVSDGTPTAVFGDTEPLEAAGLAAPPMVTLTHALNARGLNLPEGLFTVEAVAQALFTHVIGAKSTEVTLDRGTST